MQLFYSSGFDEHSDEIYIEGQEATHISKVLRHWVNDVIYVTNGRGVVAKGRISAIGKNRVEVASEQKKRIDRPVFSNITLGVGLIKHRDRLEWMLEKATEIGVGEIVLFASERSEKSNVREDRLQNIVLSAMKQSLQVWEPKLKITVFDEVIGGISENDMTLIAHEQANEVNNYYSFEALASEWKKSVGESAEIEKSKRRINLLVGPEGGFSTSEVQKVVNKGGKTVVLGVNRLRTETAAVKLLVLSSEKIIEDVGKRITLYEAFSL